VLQGTQEVFKWAPFLLEGLWLRDECFRLPQTALRGAAEGDSRRGVGARPGEDPDVVRAGLEAQHAGRRGRLRVQDGALVARDAHQLREPAARQRGRQRARPEAAAGQAARRGGRALLLPRGG